MLKNENCTTDYSKANPLTTSEISSLLNQISSDWQILEINGEPRLQKVFHFKNFSESLHFSNIIGKIAEEQNHHPALLTEWGKTTVSWWTHVLHGLHRNDFIMAARTDEAYQSETDR